MQIDQFPRPAGDTGLGFHFGTGVPRYAAETQAYWLDQLGALGASWLVLPSGLDAPVPERFIRELVRHQIEPIIRVEVWPIQPVDLGSLGALCRSYAAWGVHYLHIYREPNLATQWRLEDWTAPGLADRFARLLLPALEAIRANGLIPLLSPLAPGGHYWDLTFLDQLLTALTSEGNAPLLESLGVCVHNYATNRPLSWGEGGPERWPQARPYHTPADSEDHRGFRLFEWYDAVIRRRLRRSLPIISGESGLVLGTRDHPGFERVDEALHRERTVAIADAARLGALPAYVFNVAFWTLSAGEDDPVDAHAWYRRDGSIIATVDALKARRSLAATPPTATANEPTPPPAEPPPSPPPPLEVPRSDGVSATVRPALTVRTGPIDHYLLIDLSSYRGREAEAAEIVITAARYAAATRATLGFRLEEARLAQSVTVIGADPDGLIQMGTMLEAASCQVDLQHAASADKLGAALDGLLERGRRFAGRPG